MFSTTALKDILTLLESLKSVAEKLCDESEGKEEGDCSGYFLRL